MTIKSDRGGYYDRFRGRLVFPLKNHRGEIVGFAGRVLPPGDETQAKYINSPETPIYIKGDMLYGLDMTKESIKREKNAVVVEGELDMLSSYQTGVTNVVAIKGSALTEGQVLLLKRYTENLDLALDSDFAGNEAAARGIEIADQAGLNIKVINLLAGKDPHDCIIQGAHLWKKSIEKPVPVYDFIIQKAMKKYDKKDIYGKRKIGNEVAPYLSKISNPIVRSHYIKILSRELEVTEESIEILLSRQEKKEKTERIPQAAASRKMRVELLEEYLLALILQSETPKEILAKSREYLNDGDFLLPTVGSIIRLLSGYFVKHEKLDIKNFGKMISPELADVFDRAYLSDLSANISAGRIKEEAVIASSEIKKACLRRKIHDAATKIKKMENEGKEEEVSKASGEIKTLLSQIADIEVRAASEVK